MHAPSKQAMVDFHRSKIAMSAVQRPSLRPTTSDTKKRVVSKLSVFGPVGSRMFYHKRGDRLRIPRYQNTFRLEPFRPFHANDVDVIVENVMIKRLKPVTSYEPAQAAKLCLDIGSDVQKAIVKKDYDRYKVVAQVAIAQRLDQSIHASFQCLWDSERDNYSYYVFENSYIYAWCTVFGMYYE